MSSSYELCVTLPKRTELCQIRQFRMNWSLSPSQWQTKKSSLLWIESYNLTVFMQKLCGALIFLYLYDFLFQGEIECELYWKQSPRIYIYDLFSVYRNSLESAKVPVCNQWLRSECKPKSECLFHSFCHCWTCCSWQLVHSSRHLYRNW